MRSRRFQRRFDYNDSGGQDEPHLSATSLFLLGLILGLAGALYFAWVVSPIVYTQASPSRLSAKSKDEYILLVSQSYTASGDWAAAEQRLTALADPDISRTIADQLEAYLRRGEPAAVVRNLAVLAEKVGSSGAAVALFVPTEEGPAPTSAPAAEVTLSPTETPPPTSTRPPTSTPRPTSSPTMAPSPTLVPVFRLLSQERVCDRDQPAPRIEIIAVDAFLEPLPGVEVIVQWTGGMDRFFTGFQPEKGLGYGDFAMTPDVSYSVFLAEGSPTISGLRVEPCPSDEGGLPGGWQLTFQNTDVPQETPTPEAES
jgi:hypothetical protein